MSKMQVMLFPLYIMYLEPNLEFMTVKRCSSSPILKSTKYNLIGRKWKI